MKTTTNQLALAATVTALVAGAALGADAAYDAPVRLDLTFVYHVDAEMPEQDVFIEREPGSGKVFRVTKGDRKMQQPIFATAGSVPHSPFEIDAIGPHAKGRPLGLTLGQWFDASGKGSYRCTNGEGAIDVDFRGLVPNGIYTLWHFFMASPPTQPFVGTYDLPMGSRDGKDSVFSADARGQARVQRTFKPCLQLSGEHLMAGLAVAWHSDGKTHGVEPGGFGHDSHVQLFLGLPQRSGL